MKKLFRSRFVYCALAVCFVAAPALAAAVKAGNFEKTIGSRDKRSTESVQIVSKASNEQAAEEPLAVNAKEEADDYTADEGF